MTVSALPQNMNGFLFLKSSLVGIVVILSAGIGWLQFSLDTLHDRPVVQIESLAQLPNGQYLKPASLGYQHFVSRLLWLQLIQVLGKKRNTADEYEWIYHALDVITTLDPQYSYAYEVGGTVLTELAHRVDLSNRILRKGTRRIGLSGDSRLISDITISFIWETQERRRIILRKPPVCREGPRIFPGLRLECTPKLRILTWH